MSYHSDYAGDASKASFSKNNGKRTEWHGQSLCSRNAHDQNVLVRRPQLGLATPPCNERVEGKEYILEGPPLFPPFIIFEAANDYCGENGINDT